MGCESIVEEVELETGYVHLIHLTVRGEQDCQVEQGCLQVDVEDVVDGSPCKEDGDNKFAVRSGLSVDC